MKKHSQNRSRLVVAVCTGLTPVMAGLSLSAMAELREINDKELSNVVGQAVIGFDEVSTGTTRQSRFRLGSKIETHLNTDQVTLAEYEIPDAETGADVDIAHMSLGHTEENFFAENPYFEVIEQNGEMTGFRIGFEKARGTISGNINSYSGALGMEVLNDDGTPLPTFLLDSENNQTNKRATRVGTIIVPDPVEQPAQNEEQPPTASVSADPVFGDDPQLAPDLPPAPLAELPPRLLTNDLSEFKSFEIGSDDGSGSKQLVNDFFFAFQKEEVEWQSFNGNEAIKAEAGIHLNIPSGMQLTIPQFEAGVPRAQTHFVDSGSGLF